MLLMDDRKPYQQQTLSIRISESMRDYLERARKVFSAARGEVVSVSDVAKILLEGARHFHPGLPLEVAELLGASTEALAEIRTKWQHQRTLSRAELTFLAIWVQTGCERLSEDPTMPTAASYIAVLEAVLAVRDYREARSDDLDDYYRENIPVPEDEEEFFERTAKPVPDLYRELIERLRQSPEESKPVLAGRCLFVAFRDEPFNELESVNKKLLPLMPDLFRLAARGHWIREHRPVRPRNDGFAFVANIPPALAEGFRLTVSGTADGDLSLNITMTTRALTYPLTSYPQIREFAALLQQLEPGNVWNGRQFSGSADVATSDRSAWFHFRRYGDGVSVSLAESEWAILKNLFLAVLAEPTLQPLLNELSLMYGEL